MIFSTFFLTKILQTKSHSFFELKTHAKFQNPTITPSVRKVSEAEERKKEKEEEKKKTLIVDT